MLEVEAISLGALQNSLNNGMWERSNSKGIENIKHLREIDSTKQKQADPKSHATQSKDEWTMNLKQQEDHSKEMDREFQRLLEENTSLRSLNEMLEREVKGKGDEVLALRKELSQTQLDATIKIKAMEQHATNLESELTLVNKQRAQVEERVLSMTKNLTKGKDAVKKLTGELMSKISAQEKMINNQRDRVDKTASSCRIARDEISRSMGGDFQVKEERIRELEVIIEEQSSSIQALELKNREVSIKCNQLEAQKSNANKVLVKLQEQVKKSDIQQILMSHKLNVSKSAHTEIEENHKSKVHDLESRCIRLEAQCVAFQKDVERKEGELQQMNGVVKAAFLSLGDEMGKLESAIELKIEHLDSRILACSQNHQNLRDSLEKMVSRKSDLELQNHGLVSGMTKLSEGFSNLALEFEKRIEHLESRISKCFEGAHALKSGLEAVTSRNSKLQFENHELMKGIMGLNEGFKKLESSCLEQIDNLHSKLSKCSEGNQVLKEGLEAVSFEKSDLEVRNHEMMVRVMSLSQGVNMMEMGFRDHIDQLESRLARCTEANQILEHGLEVLTSKKKVLELENRELKSRIDQLSDGVRKLRGAFDQQIEYLDGEVTRRCEENQIIKEGLQEVTSRKHEIEDENRELVRGLMVTGECLNKLEMLFQEQMEFANTRLLSFSEGYKLMEGCVKAMASRKKELEMENKDLMAKIAQNEKDVVVLKEEVAKAIFGAREGDASDHEKRMHELQEEAAREKEDYQGKIMELERSIEALEENVKSKDEEKRQAIMQLCLQIEYHRDKYDNLARKKSKTLW